MTWTPDTVRSLRSRLGLSQRQFAELIARTSVHLARCGKTTVAQWEQGLRSPDLAHSEALNAIAAQDRP